MYLVTFRTDTRRITSAGKINPKYMVEMVPEGAAYANEIPAGNIMDYVYTESGEFVFSKEDDYAENQN